MRGRRVHTVLVGFASLLISASVSSLWKIYFSVVQNACLMWITWTLFSWIAGNEFNHADRNHLPLIFASTSNPVCRCALKFWFEWRRRVTIFHSAEWNMCSMWCNLCCQSDASLPFICDDISTCCKQIGCQIWIFGWRLIQMQFIIPVMCTRPNVCVNKYRLKAQHHEAQMAQLWWALHFFFLFPLHVIHYAECMWVCDVRTWMPSQKHTHTHARRHTYSYEIGIR